MSKTSKEDLDIIISAQNGDEDAWRNLVTRYSKRVWYATYGYGFSDADREDIVQEVFSKLIKSIKSYDPNKASFSTFITTITKRKCIDKIRKPLIEEPFEPEKLAKIPSTKKEDGDDEDIQNKVKILRQVMYKELTSEQKLVITLFYYEKCSYEQIAEIMNRNEHWVKNTLHRTRAYLSSVLTEHFDK